MAEFRTPEFRLSFPYLTKQRKNDNGEDNGYGVSALIPKNGAGVDTFIKQLRQEVKAALLAKFGDSMSDKLRAEFNDNKAYPMRDGDNKGLFETWRPEYAGHYVVGFNSGKMQPSVFVASWGKKTLSTEEINQELYAGCYCVAIVNAFAYSSDKKKGASLGMNGLVKMRDGEPLGAKVASADDFEDLLASATDGIGDLGANDFNASEDDDSI